jgi:MATE family multidrug resistance protein
MGIDYSLRGIAKVTIPLVLVALSSNLMLFADRVIVGIYSIDAMNAMSISGNMVAIVSYMFVSMACTAEVYVGQYNGSDQKDQLAKPVWQMIYLAILSIVVFVLFGSSAEYISMLPEYYKKDGIPYQALLSYFGFLPCLFAAISAFFIGRGKTTIITATVFLGNVLNIALDILLVPGIEGVISPMGTSGAATATIVSEFVQVAILACKFLSKKYRIEYHTLKNRKFDKAIFMGCCKMGAPMSIGRVFEISAWYFVFVAISHVNKDLSTVYGISSNVYILFIFVGEGLNKAISTLSANLIGQQNLDGVKKLLKAFTIMTLSSLSIVALPFVLYPECIFFLLEKTGNDMSCIPPSMLQMLLTTLKMVFVSILFESMTCVVWGVLISGGDTKYPIVANLSTLWGAVVIPIIFMYYTHTLNSVIVVYCLCIVWACVSFFLLYNRYKSLKWYNKLV